MRIIVLVLALSLSFGFAQEKDQKDINEVKQPTSMEEKLQIDIDPNVFVYRPMGRRDPFKSLLKGKESNKRGAEEGIAGLTISELVLEGIVFGDGLYRAYMKGPDNYPYSVRVGDSVYNGKVIDITASTVVFKQILTVALGGTKEKLITKYLNPGEEADKK